MCDLSGINTVAGEGMLCWRVLDHHGRKRTIEINGYHIPKASVCLLSPQTLFKLLGGHTSKTFPSTPSSFLAVSSSVHLMAMVTFQSSLYALWIRLLAASGPNVFLFMQVIGTFGHVLFWLPPTRTYPLHRRNSSYGITTCPMPASPPSRISLDNNAQ